MNDEHLRILNNHTLLKSIAASSIHASDQRTVTLPWLSTTGGSFTYRRNGLWYFCYPKINEKSSSSYLLLQTLKKKCSQKYLSTFLNIVWNSSTVTIKANHTKKFPSVIMILRKVFKIQTHYWTWKSFIHAHDSSFSFH